MLDECFWASDIAGLLVSWHLIGTCIFVCCMRVSLFAALHNSHVRRCSCLMLLPMIGQAGLHTRSVAGTAKSPVWPSLNLGWPSHGGLCALWVFRVMFRGMPADVYVCMLRYKTDRQEVCEHVKVCIRWYVPVYCEGSRGPASALDLQVDR